MEGVVDGGSEKGKNGGGGQMKNGGGGQMDEAALKKCLEENKGDHEKCKPKIEALKSTTRKPITPLRLRSGSLTDV